MPPDPNPDPNNPDPNTPPPVTMDLVNEAINKALGPRLSRVEKTFTDAIGGLKTTVEGMAPAPKDPDDLDDDDKDKDKGDKLSPAAEKRIRAAEKRAEKAEELATSEKDKRETAEKAEERSQERGALRKGFKAAGVMDEYLDDLVDAECHRGTIKRDDDGEILWKARNKDEDDMSLADGIKGFVESDRGKHYLPAKGGRGSGNNPGQGGGGGRGKGEEVGDEELMDFILG